MRDLIKYFDRSYVINLPERSDRLAEAERQFRKCGLAFSENLRIFSGIRPDSQGSFYALGAKGSFYSHRAVLAIAKEASLRNVLIFEDDVKFYKVGKSQIDAILAAMRSVEWDIIYFGYLEPDTPSSNHPLIPWTKGTIGGHFYAVNGPFISTMIDYMNACETRPPGHKEGGPSGRDGAFNHFLLVAPNTRVFLANPVLAGQRSSRSDITPMFLDTGPLRAFVQFARIARNRVTDLISSLRAKRR